MTRAALEPLSLPPCYRMRVSGEKEKREKKRKWERKEKRENA
jgi:hypothetical protein